MLFLIMVNVSYFCKYLVSSGETSSVFWNLEPRKRYLARIQWLCQSQAHLVLLCFCFLLHLADDSIFYKLKVYGNPLQHVSDEHS